MDSAPLKWHGGKTYLLPWLKEHFPKSYSHFCSPFFGGGPEVFFLTALENVSEAVNDLNGDLVNFYRVLRDPEQATDLQLLLALTPVSRDEFERASASLGGVSDPVARAAAFFVKYRMSRQALGKDFITAKTSRTRRGMNEAVSSYLSAVEGLPEAHLRLQEVVIENRPAVEFIKAQDGYETFFYVDPPYLPDTRSLKKAYELEMSEEDHGELLLLLGEIKGKFLLSGYPSEMYDQAAEAFGWRRVSKDVALHSSSAKEKPIKSECLWMNYDPSAAS